MKKLNFDSLRLAILQLEKGLKESGMDPQNELMRDGVIQRFEYTMDLAWKMMQRYLKTIQSDESVIRSKNDLFREMERIKIINNAESWIGYYSARNETSHDYDTKKADLVYQQVHPFLSEVKNLLETLIHAH